MVRAASPSASFVGGVRWWKHLAGSRGGDAEKLSYETGKRIAESIVEYGIEATPTDFGLKGYRHRLGLRQPAAKQQAPPIVEATIKFRRDRDAAAAKQSAKQAAQAKAAGDKRKAEAAKQQALLTRQLWAEYTTILAGASASREDVERLDKLMSELGRSENDLRRDMTVVESEREYRAQLKSFRQKGWDWATAGPKAGLAGLAKKRPEMFDDADPPALLTASPTPAK